MGRSSIKEELAEWRKLVKSVLRRLDRPERLDKNWTRGTYGVAYDPERSGLCSRHKVIEKDGEVRWINDPFCRVCFPSAGKGARYLE